jgi:hypothetical protein
VIKVEIKDGEVLLVDGPEKTAVEDDDEAQLLRDVLALQASADESPAPEAIAALVRRDMVRLLKRAFGTFTLHLQDLEDEIEDLKENPPGSDGHVMISLDELKKVLGVLVPVADVLKGMQAAVEPSTPELAAAAESYGVLSQQVRDVATLFAFKVTAYEEAAAEDEEEEGEEGDGEDAPRAGGSQA